MLLIYTPHLNSRISYIFKLVFGNLLKTDYSFCDNLNDYRSFSGCRINYSKTAIVNEEIHIVPAGLLFENVIRTQEIKVTEWENMKIFFQTDYPQASLAFDIFAASFYLVSRYEEYLPFRPDRHNRYNPHESLAFQNDFLHLPMVNIWMKKLGSLIEEKCPDIKIETTTYTQRLTFDIDIAYAYKHKGFIRTVAAYSKMIMNLKFRQVCRTSAVLTGRQHDPYDTYDYIIELIEKHKLPAVFFFLLGDFSTWDKNLSFLNLSFRSLIKHVADYAEVGIHASYASNYKPELIEKEINRLKGIINKEVKHNRQHFILLKIPETYRRLAEAEITDDYSMGYPSEPGFRAGICSPFHFYNLSMEYETNILVHPFAYMDGTFIDYLKMEPSEALTVIKKLTDVVRDTNGEFISLWHNHTLSNENQWKDWKNIFESAVLYGL